MKGNDELAVSLWGEFYSEIQKGIFAAAAFYFADASKEEGQTAQERFFEVWKGMEELGAPAPSSGARRALKKFLKSLAAEEAPAVETPEEEASSEAS